VVRQRAIGTGALDADGHLLTSNLAVDRCGS
jgi:hypothetical protein